MIFILKLFQIIVKSKYEDKSNKQNNVIPLKLAVKTLAFLASPSQYIPCTTQSNKRKDWKHTVYPEENDSNLAEAYTVYGKEIWTEYYTVVSRYIELGYLKPLAISNIFQFPLVSIHICEAQWTWLPYLEC